MTCHLQLVVNFVMSSSECLACLFTDSQAVVITNRKFTGLVPMYSGTFECIIYTRYSKSLGGQVDVQLLLQFSQIVLYDLNNLQTHV